jgi:hypothetical protein
MFARRRTLIEFYSCISLSLRTNFPERFDDCFTPHSNVLTSISEDLFSIYLWYSDSENSLDPIASNSRDVTE